MSPLYIACYNGCYKVVQVLLNHGVQVNVPDKVNNIWYIHVMFSNTTEGNNASLVTKKKQMISVVCVRI